MLFTEQRVGLSPFFAKKSEKTHIFEHELKNMVDFAIEMRREKVYNEGAIGRKEDSHQNCALTVDGNLGFGGAEVRKARL